MVNGLQIRHVPRLAMKKSLKWVRCLFSQHPPLSIVASPELIPIASGTEKLIVLRIDFPLNAQKAADLDSTLEPLRKKFGLDFIVLEPGMSLSRFDDI